MESLKVIFWPEKHIWSFWNNHDTFKTAILTSEKTHVNSFGSSGAGSGDQQHVWNGGASFDHYGELDCIKFTMF